MKDSESQQNSQEQRTRREQTFNKRQDSFIEPASSASESTPESYDADDGGIAHTNNHDVLRTVTQYTEYALVTGEAMNDELKRVRFKEEGQRFTEEGPTNVYNLSSHQFCSMFILPYIRTIIILSIYLFSVFSIYWGACYERSKRLVNLKVLVVLEPLNGNAVLSQALGEITEIPLINKKAGWHIITDQLSESEIIRKHLHS
ncbi:unnamed protein product [Ambrosiozyma monospora]|uniref:Unnamed protein product n=1 Tax=Ambrosiozyma monospora TaxID=43982 RepID=A0ACB5U258_AMBMO|nr:unnamed protein product [Ambrosiozyma monospora]